MKVVFLCIGFICLPASLPLVAQEIALKGQVSIHNSKYRTGTIDLVQNAFVQADSAGSVNTDVNGNFKLIFSGISIGTSVTIKIEKAGLEIVNQNDLQDVVLGRRIPLKVYLAPKGQIAKARVELYRISIQTLTENTNV